MALTTQSHAKWMSDISVLAVMLVIVFFAVGPGAVAWVVVWG